MKSIKSKLLLLICLFNFIFVFTTNTVFAEINSINYKLNDLKSYALSLEENHYLQLNADIENLINNSINNIENYTKDKINEVELKLAIHAIELEKEIKEELLINALDNYTKDQVNEDNTVVENVEKLEIENESQVDELSDDTIESNSNTQKQD